LLALQNVVKAKSGMTQLDEKTHKSRTSLYKTLSETGNSHLQSTNEILHAMGMHLAVIPTEVVYTTN
jgi:probable addiction module antidote protein